jgi:myosin heavy subunit
LNRPVEHPEGSQFLHISQAASALGVSRMVLREGIAKGLIAARRDNEGNFRIDLADVPADLLLKLPTVEAAPATMIEVLRDEVGDMQHQLDDAERQREQLESLLARQAQALAQSAVLMERQPKPSDESGEDVSRIGSVADRSFELLEETTAALQKSRAENARLTKLVERAFQVVEETQQTSQQKIDELTATAERSVEAVNRAVEETRVSRQENERLSQLIERSMQAGARLEEEMQGREQVIESQDGLLQRLFNLTEHMDGAPPKNRFWRWWRRRGSGI